MGVRLSPRAQADIDEIWDYTCDRWGLDQADRYVGQIRDAIFNLTQAPLMSKRCDDIREGYRRLNAGSHVIFFKHQDTDIMIVRVLHARMDPERNLN